MTFALTAHTLDSFGTLIRLLTFDRYEDALTAFHAADSHRADYPEVTHYAVRDNDDPKVVDRNPRRYFNESVARAAVRESHRKEVGATATSFIKTAGPGTPLDRLTREAQNSLRERGIPVERWAVEDALKSRILIGRCPSSRHAYWVKKSEGPLHKLSCPHCGHRLAQTTLALQAPFVRLEV